MKKIVWLWLISFSVFASNSNAFVENICPFQVFDEFCLGGNINLFLNTRPDITHQQQDGDLVALVYTQNGHDIYVMSYHQQVYKVLKQLNQNSMGYFQQMEQAITSTYGMASDTSVLTRKDKLNQSVYLNSVLQGDASMKRVWIVPDALWHIELSWEQPMGITLSYKIDGIAKPGS